MKTVDSIKFDHSFVSINNLALNRKDISAFSWNETKLEVQVFMRSGYEHSFSFEDQASFAEAVWKLSK